MSTLCGVDAGVVVDLREQRDLVVLRERAQRDRRRRQHRLELLVGPRPSETPRPHADVSTSPLMLNGAFAKSGTSRSYCTEPTLPPAGSCAAMRSWYLPGGRSIRFSMRRPVCSIARLGLGLQIRQRQRIGVAALHLAVGVDRDIREQDLSIGIDLHVAATQLDAEQHRRIRRGALERRREHVHRQAADRQRAVERLAQLRRRRAVACRLRRVGLLRRQVALARADGQTRAASRAPQSGEPARARVRRVVRQHVVRAVVLDDALEGGREVVAVDDGKTAGLLGQRAQAVLRQPQLVLQRALPMPSDVSSGNEPSSIDSSPRSVRPRGSMP